MPVFTCKVLPCIGKNKKCWYCVPVKMYSVLFYFSNCPLLCADFLCYKQPIHLKLTPLSPDHFAASYRSVITGVIRPAQSKHGHSHHSSSSQTGMGSSSQVWGDIFCIVSWTCFSVTVWKQINTEPKPIFCWQYREEYKPLCQWHHGFPQLLSKSSLKALAEAGVGG